MTTKMQQITGASYSLSPESPSFTSYSSENIADIAARVVKELNLSHDDPYDDDFYSNFSLNDALRRAQQPARQDDVVEPQNDEKTNENDVDEEEESKNSDEEDEESEFEFAILCGEDNSSPISADEIFSNGQIKPMFPIFNTDLIYGYNQNDAVAVSDRYNYNHPPPSQTIRLPLRKLLEERENRNGAVSCSSSEADDLDGVPPGTYCVWTPKKKEEVMKMRKKSKSTGSSKRWRFKDLLYRSNSDGKDTFVFLTPSNHHHQNQKAAIVNGGDGKRREKMLTVGRVKNINGEKKKSYLPYRQDLVGFFANVNGISRTVRPF